MAAKPDSAALMPGPMMPGPMMPGPMMIDVADQSLTAEDCELIAHPLVGGIILFSRNYENPAQLATLVEQMRMARKGPLLIAVDQEGGTVQRFRDGFTRIPPMRHFGYLFDTDQQAAITAVENATRLIAWELSQCAIDFTFAPVVDIDHGAAQVIGDRSFHHTDEGVVLLAKAAISGFERAGFASVIKHFPGHGSVTTDTHVGMACDHRSYAEIEASDLKPFISLSQLTTAVMPAHVVYDQVDNQPASMSGIWQTEILRQSLRFTGAVISDDLSMGAITSAVHQSVAAEKALQAGTDLVLICNDRQAVMETIDSGLLPADDADTIRRRLTLCSRSAAVPESGELAAVRQQLIDLVTAFGPDKRTPV